VVGLSLVLPKELLRYVILVDFFCAWSLSEEGVAYVVFLSGMISLASSK
jgi:hypothetical protein